MKLNSFIILSIFVGIYQGICFAAAVPIEPAPALQESVIVPPPPSYDITFPHRPAKILIYTEDPDFGDNLGEYLRDNDIREQLAHTLNVTLAPGVSFINNAEQFNEEMALRGEPERIIFAAGATVTSFLINYLRTLMAYKLVNSVILFDPTMPILGYSLRGIQLVPNYSVITNRIYNFYNKVSRGLRRKIYPENHGMMPKHYDNSYYFQGINICVQVIDENGAVTDADFKFKNMDKTRFGKIIESIVKANKYRLQPDLNSIIQNNTSAAARQASLYPLRKVANRDLPIVYIREKISYEENPPTISAMIVDFTGSAVAGTKEEYNCAIPRYLASYFKELIQREEQLSTHVNQSFATKETKIEDELRGYEMVTQNPYTLERFAERGEIVDKVETDIKTNRMEREYIEKRRPRVLQALQQLCPGAARPINIAIVASGGGSRAMFATYGALKGLQELGVLGAISYICGLSGSTWAIASLFIEANLNSPRANIKDSIIKASRESADRIYHFGFLTEAILKVPLQYFQSYPTPLKVKSLFNQPITNTDYYGCGIAKYVMGREGLYSNDYVPNYLSYQLGEAARWHRKNYRIPADYVPLLPFPIYTAVMPLCNNPTEHFPWFEFTPYEIGTVLRIGRNKAGMFVKTWSFGREFSRGRTADNAPEQALEFYLGVFSSAMNSSLREAAAMIAPMCPTVILKGAQGLKYVASWIPGTGYFNPEYRWRFAEVLNPMYEMTEDAYSHFSSAKNLPLIDAGIAFNLPFPPLNDHDGRRPLRKPDVIIFIDASADAANVNDADIYENKMVQAWPNGKALQDVADYARDYEVPFPALPRKDENLAVRTCRVFNEPGNQKPVVIYLPLTKNIHEITPTTTYNGRNILQQVLDDNTVGNEYPIDLRQVNLADYTTAKTGLTVQRSVDLMALMEYNVLFNGNQIKRAICDRVLQQAPQPAAPAAPVPVAPAH